MLDRRLVIQSLTLGLAGSLSLPALAQAPTALLDPARCRKRSSARRRRR
jgi:hypothetical protein